MGTHEEGRRPFKPSMMARVDRIATLSAESLDSEEAMIGPERLDADVDPSAK